jgi:hypothetical protein
MGSLYSDALGRNGVTRLLIAVAISALERCMSTVKHNGLAHELCAWDCHQHLIMDKKNSDANACIDESMLRTQGHLSKSC